ncbi:MAG: LysR family transcriptional regulator, partial [Pseudomonadota bacterium]
MASLNYHHLRYFAEVAEDGHLTRTADRLNLSQSALSAQIRTLEDRLGQPLFDRVGRRLVLTEAGHIALAHARRIFRRGQDLLAVLDQSAEAVPTLRVGALSTLSRNFQMRFLSPVLGQGDLDLMLQPGSETALLSALRAWELDIILTTRVPEDALVMAHRIDAQPIGLHGVPSLMTAPTLGALLGAAPFILPTEPSIHAGFAGLCDRHGVAPRIAARVDDMAMVRLLARAGQGVAVAPAVVVAGELSAGRLVTAPFTLPLEETFYAVTLPRLFPHP